MDYTPVQDLTAADCRIVEAQLKEMKLNYPKWVMPTYPDNVHSFANFRTAMEFKFTEANVMDVINAVSVQLDPLPADVDIPAVQKNLHEYRMKIFTLKKFHNLRFINEHF